MKTVPTILTHEQAPDYTTTMVMFSESLFYPYSKSGCNVAETYERCRRNLDKHSWYKSHACILNLLFLKSYFFSQ